VIFPIDWKNVSTELEIIQREASDYHCSRGSGEVVSTGSADRIRQLW
jgi:hypothetical protein